MILRKEGSGETGWIDYETSGVSNSAFFRTITYRQYAEDGKGPVAPKVLTHVSLDLQLRYELCFTGDELVEKYFSGSLEEFAKAQPMEPSGTVFPLQINGTEVSIVYRRGSKCLAEVSLSRVSPPP